MVSSNGGLNQMRAGICDMVAIASYINVTLIVPELDKTSFWNDYSEFKDIFDVDYFITSLRDKVKIQRELPPNLKKIVEMGTFYSYYSVSWSNMSYYSNTVKKETLLKPSELLPFQNHSSQMAALDYIVSVESDIFVATYGGNMAKVVEGHRRFLGFKKTLDPNRKIVVNLTDKYNKGKLKWEKFSAVMKEAHANRWGKPADRVVIPGKPKDEDYFCEFKDIFDVDYFITSLRDKVKIQRELPPNLKKIVEMGTFYSMPPISWSNMSYYSNTELVDLQQICIHLFNININRYAYPWWKDKVINSTKKRKAGLCPMTPEEAALTLRALDIDRNIQIYIAAGDIYGGKTRLASLAAAFPNLVKKETLLKPSELFPFQNHSSQMAALDYIVSVESDIFVATYGGNMAKVVEGHRRFLGFKKTLDPNRKIVVNLTDKYNKGKLKWEKFSAVMKEAHANRWGKPADRVVIPGKPKDEDYFWSNPQECLAPPSPSPST
ncbi:rhamnogalacturonan I rhamnosyltransferase 1-like [Camellia sinensis]|uniref:rhamnogalacturonan I rhamnosyltransferase 1-like n=2 Tax=Camellia sinensis TaxID=4442 RepID=UPI001036AA56|nr:rhamnogalacturonan I rhamnosyltransferase 1-like [Camellia sinensis]